MNQKENQMNKRMNESMWKIIVSFEMGTRNKNKENVFQKCKYN